MAAFAVWASLPDEDKSALLRKLSFSAAKNAPTVERAPGMYVHGRTDGSDFLKDWRQHVVEYLVALAEGKFNSIGEFLDSNPKVRAKLVEISSRERVDLPEELAKPWKEISNEFRPYWLENGEKRGEKFVSKHLQKRIFQLLSDLTGTTRQQIEDMFSFDGSTGGQTQGINDLPESDASPTILGDRPETGKVDSHTAAAKEVGSSPPDRHERDEAAVARHKDLHGPYHYVREDSAAGIFTSLAGIERAVDRDQPSESVIAEG